MQFIGNTVINTGGAGIVTTACDYIISDHNLTRCAVSGMQAWFPTCDIDAGFGLASTSPGYGNIAVDPTTLTGNTNIQADLRTYIYSDINGNPRGQSTGKWDLGAYQH